MHFYKNQAAHANASVERRAADEAVAPSSRERSAADARADMPQRAAAARLSNADDNGNATCQAECSNDCAELDDAADATADDATTADFVPLELLNHEVDLDEDDDADEEEEQAVVEDDAHTADVCVSEQERQNRRKKMYGTLQQLLGKLRQSVTTLSESTMVPLHHARKVKCRLATSYQGAAVGAPLQTVAIYLNLASNLKLCKANVACVR